MSFKGFPKSPYQSSPTHNIHTNDHGRNTSFKSPNTSAHPTTSLPGWGTPAVGYSPRGNRQHGSPYNQYSPRGNNFSNAGQYGNSPRGQNQSHNRSYNNSPRNFTPSQSSNNRFSSPNDVFKTPQSPLGRSYSSPASLNSFNSNGKRSYNQRFQQNSRRGRNFAPRGSSSIEDYYHNSMVEDPWKFTPPVPVLAKS